MKNHLELPSELRSRIAAISEQSGTSPADIVVDALENGHSLEWQERFLKKVQAGLEASERGDFATAKDIEQVRSKYRSS